MKKNPGQSQPDIRSAIRPLLRGLAIVAGVTVLLTGCNKAKSPPGEVSVPAPAASTNAAPADASAAATDTTTNGQPDMRALNRQFISYELENHTHFKTLDEYQAAAHIQLPPPPAGKKYAIDKRGYITLANQ